MVLDGFIGETECHADFLVGAGSEHQTEHFVLTRGELRSAGRVDFIERCMAGEELGRHIDLALQHCPQDR